jgi:hypothetical protein
VPKHSCLKTSDYICAAQGKLSAISYQERQIQRSFDSAPHIGRADARRFAQDDSLGGQDATLKRHPHKAVAARLSVVTRAQRLKPVNLFDNPQS